MAGYGIIGLLSLLVLVNNAHLKAVPQESIPDGYSAEDIARWRESQNQDKDQNKGAPQNTDVGNPWQGQGNLWETQGRNPWGAEQQQGQGQMTWPKQDQGSIPSGLEEKRGGIQSSKSPPITDPIDYHQQLSPDKVPVLPDEKKEKENKLKPEEGMKPGHREHGEDMSDSKRPRSRERLSEDGTRGEHTTCHLHPWNPDIHERLVRLIHDGAHLIEYTLSFPEYGSREEENPLWLNKTYNYKSNIWQRVTSSYGKVLLSMAFNYDVLSLKTLTFGVVKLDVGFVDTPAKCFGALTESEKILVAREILMNDFRVHLDDDIWLEEEDYICHQIIIKEEDQDEKQQEEKKRRRKRENDDDTEENVKAQARFGYECCTRTKESGKLVCTQDIEDKWIDVLYIIIVIVKCSLLLLGPFILQKFLFQESLKKEEYVVPLQLPEKLRKTMLVKRVHIADDSVLSDPSTHRDLKQFRKFRQRVKAIPSNEIVPVTFKKLHLYIDESRLISENSIPVGLLRFLYDNFLLCGICNIEPFRSCCSESILGSWTPRFLWIRLMKGSDCNQSMKKCLSWGHIARFLGFLLTLALIPLPYYIRIIVFYLYEDLEIQDRKHALDHLDLDPILDRNVFQYLTPTHGGLIGMYCAFIGSFLLLGALRASNKDKFNSLVRDAVEDMRHVSCLECLRMLVAHLVLPFEKFGVCGVVVAAIYWPFALPLCLLAVVFYCIPTLYLTGRFLVHTRPSCLTRIPSPSSPTHRHNTSLTNGASSFETCLLLENISPSSQDYPPSPEKRKPQLKKRCFQCRGANIGAASLSLFVSLLCIILMYSWLLMYAEAFGLLLELCVLTIIGAMVNAASAGRYVMLAFWVFIYSMACYRHYHDKYATLNRRLFAFIKEKLTDQVEKVTSLRQNKHKNTAFKFFTRPEIRENERQSALYTESEENVSASRAPYSCPQTDKYTQLHSSQHPEPRLLGGNVDVMEDTINYQKNKLHWDVNSLIFFVDKKDVPRIPKEFFQQVCQVDAPGCPGPVYKSLLKATKHFLFMVIFLILVFIVIMVFGNISDISTTNQLLLLVAFGFFPLLVQFVLRSRLEELDLNNYTFRGKVHDLILRFHQSWPVYDLSMRRDCPSDPSYTTGLAQSSASDEARGFTGEHTAVAARSIDTMPNAPDIIDLTHVDLLVTVRDEEHILRSANIRHDPGRGSLGSLSSVHHQSPGDPSQPPPYGGVGASDPPNAPGSQPIYINQQTGGANGSGYPHPGFDAAGGAGVVQFAKGPSPSDSTIADLNSPGKRRADLVVDLVKGGVQVCGETDEQAENAQNGIAMWPVQTLKRMDTDSESAL